MEHSNFTNAKYGWIRVGVLRVSTNHLVQSFWPKHKWRWSWVILVVEKIIFELGICFRYSCSILFPCHGGSRTHITMSCSFLVLLSIAGVWNTVFFEGCRPFLDSKMARSLGAMSLKRPAEVDWIFDGNQVPPGDICRYKTVTCLKCAQFTNMWFRIAQFVFCWDKAELLGNCQGKASRALMTELKNLMKDGWQDLLGWFSPFFVAFGTNAQNGKMVRVEAGL